jgi:hypothetical protein
MSRRQNIKEKGFVLETAGRALLAFTAIGIEQAKTLCAEAWFADELASYRSGGRPTWDGASELKVRCAGRFEAAEIQTALTGELARREYEGYVFAFLVPIDAVLH